MAVLFGEESFSFDEKSLELSIPAGEQRRVPLRDNLLSVEFVKVIHPQRKDCVYIYGEISFSDIESGPFVTLFKRSPDDPDFVDLSTPIFQFLTLSDNDFPSFRPLRGGGPIFVMMKLYEIVYDDDDGEDQTEQERKLVEQDNIKSTDDDAKAQITKLVEEDSPKSERKPGIEEDSDMAVAEGKQLDDGEDQSQKLKEKEQHILIANITHTFDDFYDENKRSYFLFEGPKETGFKFEVAHANVIGSIPAKVTFTINSEPYQLSKEEGPSSSLGKRMNPPTTIYGIIAANQRMKDSSRYPPSVQLFYRSQVEPGKVSLGIPLHLDRRYVVVPSAFGTFWIGYSLYCAESRNLIATGVVPFPINTDDNLFFVTDKNLSHTRKSADGRVTVTLRFITTVEADPSEPLSIHHKRIPELNNQTLSQAFS